MKKLTLFLLAPLREGRPAFVWRFFSVAYFYSRPCVRGDFFFCKVLGLPQRYFYSRPCVRGDAVAIRCHAYNLRLISTRAPA